MAESGRDRSTGFYLFIFFNFISFIFFASNHKVADKITCPSKFKSIYFEDRWTFCRSILEPTVRGLNMMMRAPFSGTDSGHSGWVLRTKHVRPASEKNPLCPHLIG